MRVLVHLDRAGGAERGGNGGERVEQGGGAGHLAQQGAQEDPLVLDTLQILVGERMPVAHVGEGVRAVQRLTARLQVQAGGLVVNRGRQAHADPADRVDDVHQPAETNSDVVLDPQAGVELHRFGQQPRAAERVSGVDLVVPEPGNLDIGVARHADEHRPAAVRRDMQDQDRVRAVPAGESGVQFPLLCIGQALAAVRAGDEPVLPGPRGRAPGVVRERVVPGQLGVEVEVHRADQDQQDEHEAAHQEQDPPRPVPPGCAAATARRRPRRPRPGGGYDGATLTA